MKIEEIKNVLEKAVLSKSVLNEKESLKELEKWKNQKVEYIDFDYFKPLKSIIETFLKTNLSGLVIKGEGGLGKTILTLNTLQNGLKSELWAYFNGYTTPLSLFKFLYQNRDKKVIVLDDIEGVFNNKTSLALLKSALWENGKGRLLSYYTTSNKLDIPNTFFLNSKIIILTNYIPKQNDISIRAMLSRALIYDINISFEDKIKILTDYVLKLNIDETTKNKAIEFIRTKINPAVRDFNFRTLKKLIEFLKVNRDLDLFEKTLQIDELKKEVIDIINHYSKTTDQVVQFYLRTGRSRATFFRIKKSLKVSTKNNVRLLK